ncbi:hypothetical protein JW968_03415 [Candidatus Woesearchaeota archaeon]|nr:hypothetical protein [Candidatus Woesearchaeota archaeon]
MKKVEKKQVWIFMIIGLFLVLMCAWSLYDYYVKGEVHVSVFPIPQAIGTPGMEYFGLVLGGLFIFISFISFGDVGANKRNKERL